MPLAQRSRYDWKLRTRCLSLGTKTLLMGILNTTPDSFSDGGSYNTPAEAIEHALEMFDEGADVVDIGGESTRPGKREPVNAQEEISRVLPVIEGVLRHRPGSILSIDTWKAATARAALEAGAEIVNDVSGFLWDNTLAHLCARAQCGVALMHTRGRPEEWRSQPPMEGVVPKVAQELAHRLQVAVEAGIGREHLVLDPGFGFGKAFEQNYVLLAGMQELARLNRPIVAGVSRKSFLARDLAPLHRVNASIAAATAAILLGAHMVRVHDVRPTREAANVADAVLAAAVA
jgi:dihydropteroate synthase